MDWYTSLQAAIDFYFTNLAMLTVLEYLAVMIMLVRKFAPKKRKGGFF